MIKAKDKLFFGRHGYTTIRELEKRAKNAKAYWIMNDGTIKKATPGGIQCSGVVFSEFPDLQNKSEVKDDY